MHGPLRETLFPGIGFLIKDAWMNFTNDSAPLHLASAMNAPVTVIYCSTVPRFGFGPLSDDSKIVEAGNFTAVHAGSMDTVPALKSISNAPPK